MREQSISPRERLIVALDFPGEVEALTFARTVFPKVLFFKVGAELFVASGPSFVTLLREMGARVFLDLKFHDIPNTVKGAVRCATRLGADIISVHLSMGRDALIAAKEGMEDGAGTARKKPILAGVTVLTSLGSEGGGEESSVVDRVLTLSLLARECGIDGIITSVKEAGEVRRTLGEGWSIITPGIRLSHSVHDHKRAGTVRDALRAGADFLVVGRPITRASDPSLEAEKFLGEIEQYSR